MGIVLNAEMTTVNNICKKGNNTFIPTIYLNFSRTCVLYTADVKGSGMSTPGNAEFPLLSHNLLLRLCECGSIHGAEY